MGLLHNNTPIWELSLFNSAKIAKKFIIKGLSTFINGIIFGNFNKNLVGTCKIIYS